MGAVGKRVRADTPLPRTRHPLFQTWHGMLSRCEKTGHVAFRYYGGRGIKVCARWHDFDAFVADMGHRPSALHTLDRFPDGNGDYGPGNVRWATRSEQTANRALDTRLPPLLADSLPVGLLRAWLVAERLTVAGVARVMASDSPSVRAWLTGESRPAHHHRIAIERLTGIDASSWMTDREFSIAYGHPRRQVAS
jgi:hypothetical protein